MYRGFFGGNKNVLSSCDGCITEYTKSHKICKKKDKRRNPWNNSSVLWKKQHQKTSGWEAG